MQTIERDREALSPETLKIVEENLLLIDNALADVRRALEQDPASRELTSLLTATHRRKLETLQRVVRLTSALEKPLGRKDVMSKKLIFSLAFAAVAATTFTAEDVDERHAAEPDGFVEIENAAGSVTVIGWDQAEIHVKGHLVRPRRGPHVRNPRQPHRDRGRGARPPSRGPLRSRGVRAGRQPRRDRLVRSRHRRAWCVRARSGRNRQRLDHRRRICGSRGDRVGRMATWRSPGRRDACRRSPSERRRDHRGGERGPRGLDGQRGADGRRGLLRARPARHRQR